MNAILGGTREKAETVIIGAGQAGEVRAPEHPPWPEGVEHLSDVAMNVAVRIRIGGETRQRKRLQCGEPNLETGVKPAGWFLFA